MSWCGGKSKFSEFAVDCLDAHNAYRARHGVPMLDLSLELCKYAQEHAKYLVACDCEKRSKGGVCGENIFIKESMNRRVYPDPYEVVKYWYDEKNNKCGGNPTFKDAKHYAQVVWRETTKLGIGCAVNLPKNKIYVVANYYPKACESNFCENVPEATRECPSSSPSKIVKIL